MAANPSATRKKKDIADDGTVLAEALDRMALDTGDVVLFDRKCNAMSVYGGFICHTQKLFGQTRWDHNGVIYKTEEGKLMFLEATMTGVKLRPLIDRIQHSRSYEVRIQKLEVNRTPEFRQQAKEFIQRVLDQDVPYEDRVQVLINAGASFVPSRIAREQLYNDIVELKRRMRSIEDDLKHRSKMTPFEKNTLHAELQSLREQHDAFVNDLDQTERSVFENKATRQDATRYFCSQLVAALYQHLGVLLPYPAATSYRPHNFSVSSDYLKLQNAAWLPQISLREHFDETQRQLIEKSAATPPPPEIIEKLVKTLQRHAVFHTFTKDELRQVASQFRRQKFVPGQVVFYQGMPGDSFYVIESGTVDVLVNYDAYAHQQPKDSIAASVTPNVGANLRRNASTSFHDSLVTANSFVHVATNGPGNAFGDSALMYGTPRRATVKCSGDLVAYALDKEAFRSIVASHPAATQSLSERQFLMQTLASHPLFANVSEQAQAAAVRKCFSLQFPKGSVILEQGQFGDYFYVVERGSCAITRHHADGNEFIDRTVEHGDAFGEAALLYNSRRGASVHALEDCKIWCMDRSILLSTTRSGSTALLDIFNKTASDNNEGESFLTKGDIASLFEDSRGVSTALTLLFPDQLTRSNFSQFAHFHMCLEAYSSKHYNPLLAEALYRTIKASDTDPKLTSSTLLTKLPPGTKPTDVQQIQKYFGKHSPSDELTYHDCTEVCQAWRKNSTSAPPGVHALLSQLHGDLLLLEQRWKFTAFDMSLKPSQSPSDAPVPFRSLFSLQDIFAAIFAGVFARSCTAPLERLKLARQVGLYPSSLNMFQSFQRMTTTAGWRTLFAGNFTHCLKVVPSFPLKLFACDFFRQHFQDLGFNSEIRNALAGGCAGVVVQAILYPLDVVRARMAIQQLTCQPKVYPTLTSCVGAMVARDGFGSFYRGFTAATVGVFPYIGINFAMYEFLRPMLILQHRTLDGNRTLSSASGQIICALGASLTAQVATYPMDVIRRKMQMQGEWLPSHVEPQYTSTWNCVQKTAASGRFLSGFYRGIVPNCVKAIPASILSYAAYETFRQIDDE